LASYLNIPGEDLGLTEVATPYLARLISTLRRSAKRLRLPVVILLGVSLVVVRLTLSNPGLPFGGIAGGNLGGA
jgi:hypothetical protein